MEVRDNRERHRFEGLIGDQIAEVGYRLDGDTITFTHTEVPRSLRGQGVGEELARHALENARERGLHVVPECPFIAAFIRRHDEFADLVRRPSDGDQAAARQ